MFKALKLLALMAASPALSDGHITVETLDEGQVRVERLEDGLTMHTYLSKGLPGGIGSVNSHIFESDTALLMFDAQFYKAAAMDLRAYIEGLGKPVDRIIISHAHPDHGFGAAYLDDLGPIAATATVIEEAAQAFPFFAQMMTIRMGEDGARANFPIDDLPEITQTVPLGSFTFGPTAFEIFELPSHETGTQSFVKVPEHGLLMVFDAIMPNAHQLVFTAPGVTFQDKIATGMEMIDVLESGNDVERLVFGHNSIEPLPAGEHFANAREGLRIYGELAESTTTAEAFADGAKAARPDWAQFYVGMTAGNLFREN